MTVKRPWDKGLMYALLIPALLIPASGDVLAQCSQDSLALQKVTDFKVWNVYNPNRKDFVVFMTFDDIANNCATYIHPPDTAGWAVTTPSDQLSIPAVRGVYTGDTDRTFSFRVVSGGTVGGATSVRIQYEIIREERWFNTIDIGAGYTPGQWIPLLFKTIDRDTLDIGLELAFPAGIVDFQGGFKFGVEDFEGYHIWRGIEPDGSDMEVIGEVSKQEAYVGFGPGGSMIDSLYFYTIIPALRETGTYISPFALGCLGYRIDIDLEDNELFWFDCNAYNGFTYYYYVTTFDRGYEVGSGRQGLLKIDVCHIGDGVPDGGEMPIDSCRADFDALSVMVDTQNDLYRVYAVPNPYRTGGSRLTTEHYQNFPDEKIRFVNTPANCRIKIFTISGDLVWEYEHRNGGGNIEWDTRNRGGEEVTSGVYLYKIEDDDGNEVYGRLVVIR